MKLALRPVGKNAPPRPRRFDVDQLVRSPRRGSIARALLERRVAADGRVRRRASRSGCSSAPARTRTGVSGIAQLLDDRGHVLGLDGLAVAAVDRDDRRRQPQPPRHSTARSVISPSRSSRPARTPSSRSNASSTRLRADERRTRRSCRPRPVCLPDGLEVEHVVEATRPTCSTRASGRARRRPRGSPRAAASRAAPARAGAPAAPPSRDLPGTCFAISLDLVVRARSSVDLAHDRVERADDRDHVGDERVRACTSRSPAARRTRARGSARATASGRRRSTT